MYRKILEKSEKVKKSKKKILMTHILVHYTISDIIFGAESKNHISFLCTWPLSALWGVLISNFDRKLVKITLQLKNNGTRWDKTDFKIGFSTKNYVGYDIINQYMQRSIFWPEAPPPPGAQAKMF